MMTILKGVTIYIIVILIFISLIISDALQHYYGILKKERKSVNDVGEKLFEAVYTVGENIN